MNIDGRTAEVKSFLETHFSAVWAYLYASTGNPVAADDLTREAFARFAATSVFSTAPISLLYATARRLWRDLRTPHLETPRIVLNGHDGHLSPANSLMAEDDYAVTAILTDNLWKQVLKLPCSQRETVILRQCGGLAFRDIANAVGRRESTIRTLYQKGIRRLFKARRYEPHTDHRDLALQLKALPSKLLTDKDRLYVLRKLGETPPGKWEAAPAGRQHHPLRRTVAIGCSAVLVVAASIGLVVHPRTNTHAHFHPQWPVYLIAVVPTAVTRTPLDTTVFRNTARRYLERHSLSSTGSPYVTSAHSAGSNRILNAAIPAQNQVSKLAVRWSHVDFGRYGYALVSFIGNGHPRTVDFVALKSGHVWSIVQTTFGPALTAEALSTEALDSFEVNGTLFYTGDNAAFQFVSGLVIDPAVTRVTITTAIGQKATAAVINGVFGFEVTDLTGKLIRGADYTIRAYNRQGVLVYTH